MTQYLEIGMASDTQQLSGRSPKHEKFRELAEGRVNKALDAINRVGNLSNRQLYEWEDAEVKKILRALKNSVNEVETKFTSPKGKSDAKFKL